MRRRAKRKILKRYGAHLYRLSTMDRIMPRYFVEEIRKGRLQGACCMGLAGPWIVGWCRLDKSKEGHRMTAHDGTRSAGSWCKLCGGPCADGSGDCGECR